MEVVKLLKSNSFSDRSKDLYEKYNEMAKYSNIDCSEITEDLMRDLGGKALLILSKEYKSYKMFDILNPSGKCFRFIYHYALVLDDDSVIDPMLEYYKINIKDYLKETGIFRNDEVVVKIIDSKTLPVYI